MRYSRWWFTAQSVRRSLQFITLCLIVVKKASRVSDDVMIDRSVQLIDRSRSVAEQYTAECLCGRWEERGMGVAMTRRTSAV